MNWVAQEIQVLDSFMAGNDYLQSGIKKFCDGKASLMEKECSRCMSTVPRDAERASDYASKAEAYRTFWKVLEAELRASQRIAA